MIVRPRPSLFTLFFILRGSIVARIAPQILGFGAYAALVVALLRARQLELGGPGPAAFTVLGVALSIYLGFRNSASYERWWEARKLWGTLVYEVRALGRNATALLGEGDEETRALLAEVLAFCHLLRGQLRRLDAGADATRVLGGRPLAPGANGADAALRAMSARLGRLKRAGRLGAIEYQVLDGRLAALGAVQAGCERIAGTPLPFAYTLLLHRSAYLFCLLLPFGLAATAGAWTPLITALVAYSFFGLDELSEELEEPFGLQPNDLPLDALCRTCEISVAEALGDPAPAPSVPDHYLYT